MVTFLNKEGEMLPGVVCCVPVKKENIFFHAWATCDSNY